MAKNSVDAYGATGKTNLLMFDPLTLTIVTDPEHPLFDERVNLPLDEAMVLNIMHYGVVEPVVVRKNTETDAVEVVAGRQRVRCAIEANKRLKAQGHEPRSIPGIVKRGDYGDSQAVMILENEIRRDDAPTIRAAKMNRMIARGASEAEVAICFGCSPQTVKNSLALLECASAVRTAVDRNQIPVTHALKLKGLSAAEQRDRVAELVAAGEGKSPREKSKAQRNIVDKGPRMRSRKEIEAALAEARQGGWNAICLEWVLGRREEL